MGNLLGHIRGNFYVDDEGLFEDQSQKSEKRGFQKYFS